MSDKRIWQAFALPLLLATAVGALTLSAGFVLDDNAAIERNAVVQGKVPLREAWTRNYWGRSLGGAEKVSWRPILPLVWRGLWAAGQGSPLPFHALSLLLHLAATALVLLLLRRLTPDSWVSWLGAVLFAVHGSHAEVVGALVSHADLVATCCGLGALILLLPRLGEAPRVGLALALLAIGTVAKESAILFWPAGVAALLAARAPRRGQGMWLIGGLVLLLGDGWMQLRSHGAHTESVMDNVLVGMAPLPRFVAALAILWRELCVSVLPLDIAPTHGYATFTDDWQAQLLPGLLAVAALGVGLWRGVLAVQRGQTALAVSLVLLFAPALLGSNLLFLAPTEYTERLLYPATVAGCLGLATACRAIRADALRYAVAALLGLLLAASTWFCQRPWHDNKALFAQAVLSEPRSWRAHLNHGRYATNPMTRLWHTLLAEDLKMHQPGPVDWSVVERLEDMPPQERLLAAPGLLAQDRACELIKRAIYMTFGRVHDEQGAAQTWQAFSTRYPCAAEPAGAAPGDAGGPG